MKTLNSKKKMNLKILKISYRAILTLTNGKMFNLGKRIGWSTNEGTFLAIIKLFNRYPTSGECV